MEPTNPRPPIPRMTLLLLSAGAFALAFATLPIVSAHYDAMQEKSGANACVEALMRMDGAVDNWAIDNHKPIGAQATEKDLVGPDKYLKTLPCCPYGPAGPTKIAIPPVGGSAVCPNDKHYDNGWHVLTPRRMFMGTVLAGELVLLSIVIALVSFAATLERWQAWAIMGPIYALGVVLAFFTIPDLSEWQGRSPLFWGGLPPCVDAQVRMRVAVYEWGLATKAPEGAQPTDADLIGPGKYLASAPVCPVGPTRIAIPPMGGVAVCPNGIRDAKHNEEMHFELYRRARDSGPNLVFVTEVVLLTIVLGLVGRAITRPRRA